MARAVGGSRYPVSAAPTLLFTANRFQALWHPELPEEPIHARFTGNMDVATVHFHGPCVHLQSIAHECAHAADWLAALGDIQTREDYAQELGYWVECIVGALLDRGWTYGPKTGQGVLWNLDVPVALVAPHPDEPPAVD